MKKSVKNETKKFKKLNINSTEDSEKIEKEFEKEEDLINQEKIGTKIIDEIFPLNEINEIFEKLSQKKVKNTEFNLMTIPKEIELLKNNFIQKKQKYYNNDNIIYNL